jgi:predicted peroxiredoxin
VRLHIIATRGTTNNLFQVATLVRAATAIEASVDVLFRDDALRKLARDAINVPTWSPVYAPIQAALFERLRAADFTDLESFLRDAKEHGDAVRFWACADTLETDSLRLDELTPLLDGALPAADFRARAQGADALLSF